MLTITPARTSCPSSPSEVRRRTPDPGHKSGIAERRPSPTRSRCPRSSAVTVDGSGSARGDGVATGRVRRRGVGIGLPDPHERRLARRHARLDGSGDATVSGTAAPQTVELSGSGALRRRQPDQPATDRDSISGSGDASVNVSDRLTASVSGSGSIDYSGSPDDGRPIRLRERRHHRRIVRLAQHRVSHADAAGSVQIMTSKPRRLYSVPTAGHRGERRNRSVAGAAAVLPRSRRPRTSARRPVAAHPVRPAAAPAAVRPRRPVCPRRARRPDVVTLRVRVDLDDIRPPIWRRLDLASDLPLDALHHILQSAFGWTDSHLHAFTAGGRMHEATAERYLTAFDLAEGDDGRPGVERPARRAARGAGRHPLLQLRFRRRLGAHHPAGGGARPGAGRPARVVPARPAGRPDRGLRWSLGLSAAHRRAGTRACGNAELFDLDEVNLALQTLSR